MSEDALLAVLERLLRLPREQATVEFKSNWEQPSDIGQYISALANVAALQGHDRAWVVWGVQDASRAVTGTAFDPFTQKVRDGANQTLFMWLQVMTQPQADFDFHEVHFESCRVVMLEIHPARSAPVAFQHVRYIRVDSHLVKLAQYPDKEARLWAMLGTKEDWSGVLVPGATFSDLDPSALAVARHRFTEFLIRSEPDASRHETIRTEFASWDDATLLNKAHITKQGRMTRAALLLLGKDEASHFLAPADTKISWVLRDAHNATVLSLDRVQKGQTLSADEIKTLRAMGLIEGRAPKVFISAKVADVAGQKARYIHNRGLDDGYYQQLVLDYLKKYGKATRADLDGLLLAKLPDVLQDQQRANKVKNLLQGMRRAKLIQLQGTRPNLLWYLAGVTDTSR
ncbi:MAG: ATP-binding protein [Burkholderiaceae bacterium]|nr:ATP-binding protein [Burkholderiaceae bacterium]